MIIPILIFILMLGVVIFVHELGHFLAARRAGIFVEEFALGMGPILFSVKGKKQSLDGKVTLYSLRAFPIGGFCKMRGENEDMADDTEALNSKTIAQRLLVMVGGSGMNFVLAFVLFFIYVAAQGYQYIDVAEILENEPAHIAGLREGDKITHVNGVRVDWVSLNSELNIAGAKKRAIKFRVRRGSKRQIVSVMPTQARTNYSIGIRTRLTDERDMLIVRDVIEAMPAYEAGLLEDDIITTINGKSVESLGFDIAKEINAGQGAPVAIRVYRGGAVFDYSIAPVPSTVYSVGARMAYSLQPGFFSAGFFAPDEAVTRVGVGEILWNTTDMMLFQTRAPFILLSQFFAGEEMPEGGGVMGPIGLGSVVTEAYQASIEYGVWEMVFIMVSIAAVLSTALGIMNLLPIPALDGSRIVFLLLEAVRKKRIPTEKEAMIHFVGLVIMLLLAVVIAYNDISTWIL
ncbi:MAG: RIP metalloprotease RseP [Defluviitaleaceae bacterium]|nr:RIP metalloprotease RseP [Defluviitaleaceae bacterium]